MVLRRSSQSKDINPAVLPKPDPWRERHQSLITTRQNEEGGHQQDPPWEKGNQAGLFTAVKLRYSKLKF